MICPSLNDAILPIFAELDSVSQLDLLSWEVVICIGTDQLFASERASRCRRKTCRASGLQLRIAEQHARHGDESEQRCAGATAGECDTIVTTRRDGAFGHIGSGRGPRKRAA